MTYAQAKALVARKKAVVLSETAEMLEIQCTTLDSKWAVFRVFLTS